MNNFFHLMVTIQACADSKIKCNLHYPCEKCVSRGRKCIFFNDPEVSRRKKYGREGSISSGGESTPFYFTHPESFSNSVSSSATTSFQADSAYVQPFSQQYPSLSSFNADHTQQHHDQSLWWDKFSHQMDFDEIMSFVTSEALEAMGAELQRPFSEFPTDDTIRLSCIFP